MKTSTRFTIVSASALLCAAGIFTANCGWQRIGNERVNRSSIDPDASAGDYQFAVSRAPKLTFQELEAIIRKDPTAKQQRGRIEFGTVRLEEGTASAEVMFVSNDGRVLPYLYKLLARRDSWKVVDVRRIWYVPRSHLLRGIRA